MILRFDARLAFVALFGAAQLLGACAKKKTKSSDSVETPTTDAGGGGQSPLPDTDGQDEDSPPPADAPPDKSIDDKKPDPGKPDQPSPYGQKIEANVASIQAKLLDVYCVACHKGETPRAGLDLTSLASHLDGTVRDTYEGRLIVPGAPEQSMLALVIDPAVDHSGGIKAMPPKPSGIPAVTAAQAAAVASFIEGLAVGGNDLGDADDDDGAGGDDRGDALDPDIDL